MRSIRSTPALLLLLVATLRPVSGQTALELFQEALALEGEGCTLNFPNGPVNPNGHRRMQLGLGGLTSDSCDITSLQDRAAEVDLACCPGDSCGGNIPTQCDYHCATHFLPFFADCRALLATIGQDMSPVEALCTPASTSRLTKAIAKASCPNAILSCSHPTGPITCVDATTGGGASPAELADCSTWTRQGGGWRASGEPCGGITAITGGVESLVQNGGFELPSLATAFCMGGHDSSFRGDDHCQYKYFYGQSSTEAPSAFCTTDCTIDSWQIGERDQASAFGAYIALAENGNGPWGGLDSHMGRQYLILESSGTYAQQTLRGLQRGQVYEVRLKMANRPGYGDDETVIVKMDNHVIGESNHPGDDFSDYGVAFTARSSEGVLRIENDTPNDEDCSVYIDEVTVTPVQLTGSIPLTNGGFDMDTLGEGSTGEGYNYQTPSGWSGSGAVIASGATAWGAVASASGPNFFALQGQGSYIEQPLGGLTIGSTYVVGFSLTDRPGYGEDEILHVKVDQAVIWESTHPEDGFTQYSAIFTATAETATLRFENDSPEGDRTVFVDSVSVSATANTLSVVLPTSSADTQPYDFQLITQALSWDAAEAECVRRNRHLASVHSLAENDYIASLHHGDDASLYQGVWIGGTHARDGVGDPEMGWSWSDGTDWDYRNWGAGEPNNGRVVCPDAAAADGMCGENVAMMAAHFSTWDDHPETGGGNDRNAARADYQWNDANAPHADGSGGDSTQAVCGAPTQSGSRTVLAYYSFDDSTARDWSGNHRDGVIEGGVTFTTQGVSGTAASFDGTGRISVAGFRQWAWGSHFAVSVWFLREPSGAGNYEGIINNGYYCESSSRFSFYRPCLPACCPCSSGQDAAA
jgi:hypothetical protein